MTFDARGSGNSDHPRAGYRFTDHAADAIAVLDATDTDVASVVAASAGTHTAVLLATRDPRRVRRLVLIAPPMEIPGEAGLPIEPTAQEGSEPDWRTDYAEFVPWFIGEAFPEPDAETTIAEIVQIGLEADHRMLLQQRDEADWDEAPRLLGAIRRPSSASTPSANAVSVDTGTLHPVRASAGPTRR